MLANKMNLYKVTVLKSANLTPAFHVAAGDYAQAEEIFLLGEGNSDAVITDIKFVGEILVPAEDPAVEEPTVP
jgi:hypothetical protein